MQDDPRTLLISIRPRFVELILGGAKTVELRRTRPKVSPGDRVLLYASSPVRELIGSCAVEQVDAAPVERLWAMHGAQSGVSKSEFDEYFAGAANAVGIVLRDARRVRRPRTLVELRERLPGFAPPQSFRYLSDEEVDRLAIEFDPSDSHAGREHELSTSAALASWRSSGLERLRELEAVHAKVVGPSRGRKWGVTQLNRSMFVALVAQFQGYCRDLHDEATKIHVDAAIGGQKQMIQLLIRQGRKLDSHNPRRSTLGHDFGRLGFSFIEELKATGPETRRQLDLLDALVDYRNAIGHGDEAAIANLEAAGGVRATKASYRLHRRSLDSLAGTMNSVVAAAVGRALGSPRDPVKEE